MPKDNKNKGMKPIYTDIYDFLEDYIDCYLNDVTCFSITGNKPGDFTLWKDMRWDLHEACKVLDVDIETATREIPEMAIFYVVDKVIMDKITNRTFPLKAFPSINIAGLGMLLHLSDKDFVKKYQDTIQGFMELKEITDKCSIKIKTGVIFDVE